MVYVITYTTRANRTGYLSNFYNGSPRHTTLADAQTTLSRNLQHGNAEIKKFANMKEAGAWLFAVNETEREAA